MSSQKKIKGNNPARIRTWNPLIRSQMPYPLGHGACHGVNVSFLDTEYPAFSQAFSINLLLI